MNSNRKTAISVVLRLPSEDAARGMRLGAVTVSHRPNGLHLEISLAKSAAARAHGAPAPVPSDPVADSAQEAHSWLQERMRRWKEQ
jgi:hypothetical protein